MLREEGRETRRGEKGEKQKEENTAS